MVKLKILGPQSSFIGLPHTCLFTHSQGLFWYSPATVGGFYEGCVLHKAYVC